MRLSPFSEKLLVRCLAQHEAPWAPIRQNWPAAPAICARRTGRVRFSAGDHDRMRALRARDELAAAGLLSGREITLAGRSRARSRAWPFSRQHLTTALTRLAEAVDRGDCTASGQVPEQFIIAGCAASDALGMLQMLLLPALADRILTSESTPQGRALYAINPTADLSAAIENIVDDSVAFDDDLAAEWRAEYGRQRAEMLGDHDYYSELGALPVVCAVVSGRSDDDLSRIPPLFDEGEGE